MTFNIECHVTMESICKSYYLRCVCVCLCVCLCVWMCVCVWGRGVPSFSPVEPERLVQSEGANTRSMRRSGGKTMVPTADRSVAMHVLRAILQKVANINCAPLQAKAINGFGSDLVGR